MPRYYVSPMGDPTIAGAVSNLGALFGNARTQAAGELAGAKVREARGKADQVDMQNTGASDLAKLMTDPRFAAIARAGAGSNAAQYADMLAKQQEQGFRQGAVDAAMAGDLNKSNAQMVGVANGPVQYNQIDDGYQLNPYQAGGPAQATTKTLAQIVTEQATQALRGAQANSANASANASNARAARTRDEMADPAKYRRGGSGAGSAPKQTKVSPNDVKALDKLIGQMAPTGSQFPNDLRNEVLTRAAANYQQTGNAQQSVADAFAELTETTPAVEGSLLNILPFTDGPVRDQPAKVGRRQAPAAPASQQAPQEVRQLGGKTYVKINGQWFEQ